MPYNTKPKTITPKNRYGHDSTINLKFNYPNKPPISHIDQIQPPTFIFFQSVSATPLAWKTSNHIQRRNVLDMSHKSLISLRNKR